MPCLDTCELGLSDAAVENNDDSLELGPVPEIDVAINRSRAPNIIQTPRFDTSQTLQSSIVQFTNASEPSSLSVSSTVQNTVEDTNAPANDAMPSARESVRLTRDTPLTSETNDVRAGESPTDSLNVDYASVSACSIQGRSRQH